MKTPNQSVHQAIENLSASIPFADEIRVVLERAWVEAEEKDRAMEEAGLGHLRNFLKTTPLGIAICDLADAINDAAK